MARIHTRTRGSSGSTKPLTAETPEWSLTDKKEIESLILELADAGNSTAMIGTILRDQHAVPDVRKVTGLRINAILAKNDRTAEIPEDLMNLLRRVVSLIEHLEGNRKDLHNGRQLELTEAKIRRLARYYRGKGVLEADWKYERDKIKLVVA